MEVINDNRIPERQRKAKESSKAGNIYLGSILLLTGALWLAYNFNWIGYGVFHILFSWPMLMVAIGGYLLSLRKWTGGVIVGGIGVVFLLIDALDIYVSFSKVVLPIIVVAIGISILVSNIDRRR